MNALLTHWQSEHWWLVIGFVGQALFFMRFFVQWIASEKRKQSYIPHAFWYFSFSGGLVLFVYAVYKQDPVFMLGQGTGLFIYARNLFLIHSQKEQSSSSSETPSNQQ